LTYTNFQTIANQISTALIVATGMTFVLISGGIDLSVGSVLALSSAVLGVCLRVYELPFIVALAACIGTGLFCGLASGLVVAAWRIPSFIVTLGMLEIARGGAYLVTDSQTVYIGVSIEQVSDLRLFGLSFPFLLALLVLAISYIALNHSTFGRNLIATGYNENVARLRGIATRRLHLAAFAICGALTDLAAIVHSARLSAADPNTGTGFELEAIAAVVIGGTSLTGGRGSVLRSALGVLIIAVLGSGLAQAGAQEYTKRLITGLVIVGAVILDRYRYRNAT
jgi:ribose transport system permease protein